MGALHTLLAQIAERLHSVGIDAGIEEAELIVGHALGVERLDMYLASDQALEDTVRQVIEEHVVRRVRREPLQYILGEAWFYGRRFGVNPSVMVPTPETELLCEAGLGFLRFRGLSSARILDIGAGSGVVCVTMALEAPTTQVVALDISSSALEVARENAQALGGAGRIEFRQSDLFAALEPTERFDLILSNPPYISEEEYRELPPEVLADPKVSLTAGEIGMDIIARLMDEAPPFLASEGKLMFEIGYNQGELVRELTERDPHWRSIVILRDLNDIDRVVILSP